MSRLDDLKTLLAQATTERHRRVTALQDEIRRVNRAYDEVATRLNREITQLEPILEVREPEAAQPKQSRTPRKPKEPDIFAKIAEWNRTHTTVTTDTKE